MKFLIISDLHIIKDKPRNRTEEDYWEEAVKPKLDFVFDIFVKERCDAILSGGDITDKATIPDSIKSYFYNQIYGKKIKFISTYGQHDTIHRSVTPDCFIHLMNEMNLIKLINNQQRFYGFQYEGIDIYGCGFEEEFPDIEFSKNYNILLLHKLVSISDSWFGNVNYVSTKQLFKKTKFNLIISGDNHKSFSDSLKDRFSFNSSLITL